MNISFPLYQSVLTGSLRPWSLDPLVSQNIEAEFRRQTTLNRETVSHTQFDSALTALCLNKISNPTAFGLNSYINGLTMSDNPSEISVLIDSLQPDTTLQKFYATILNQYHSLFIQYISAIILSNISPTERKGIINLAIDRLRGVLKQSASVTDDSDLSQFVLHHLKASIIKNIIGLENLYPHFISISPHDSIEINQHLLSIVSIDSYFNWTIHRVESPKAQKSSNSTDNDNQHLGFRYTNFMTDTEALKDIHSLLQSTGCIDTATTYKTFEKAFNGSLIEESITWQADQGALHDFIISLQDHSIIEENKQIWVTACQTFVKKTGEPFDTRKLGQDKGDTVKGRELKKRLTELNFIPHTQQ